MYLLSLGEFSSTDGYNTGYNVYSAWIMFLIATTVLMLFLLNLIIAIMGEPFDEVKQNMAVHRYKQMVEMIMDNLDKVDLKQMFKRHKYILVVQPEKNNNTDIEQEVDHIYEIRNNFQNIESIQNKLSRKIEQMDIQIGYNL